MQHLQKHRTGAPPARDAGLAERRDHLTARSAAGSALFAQARVAGITRPSRLKDGACGAGVKLAVAAPDMTRWKASWKRSISGCVPTVMRTCVGQMGQGRPIKTFCADIAAITSFAGRLASSMKQLDCDGTKE